MGNCDRCQAGDGAVSPGQREVRIGRAFVRQPLTGGDDRSVFGKRRLTIMRGDLAQHERDIFSVRQSCPADLDRHLDSARNFSMMALPIAPVPISLMPADMMSLVR